MARTKKNPARTNRRRLLIVDRVGRENRLPRLGFCLGNGNGGFEDWPREYEFISHLLSFNRVSDHPLNDPLHSNVHAAKDGRSVATRVHGSSIWRRRRNVHKLRMKDALSVSRRET